MVREIWWLSIYSLADLISIHINYVLGQSLGDHFDFGVKVISLPFMTFQIDTKR